MLRGQLRVQRDGDRARGDRAPEDDGEERPVGEKERDTVAAVNAGRAQCAGEAADAEIELAVTRLPGVSNDRHPVAPSLGGVTPHEPRGCVEAVGKVVAGAHRSAPSLLKIVGPDHAGQCAGAAGASSFVSRISRAPFALG